MPYHLTHRCSDCSLRPKMRLILSFPQTIDRLGNLKGPCIQEQLPSLQTFAASTMGRTLDFHRCRCGTSCELLMGGSSLHYQSKSQVHTTRRYRASIQRACLSYLLSNQCRTRTSYLETLPQSLKSFRCRSS